MLDADLGLLNVARSEFIVGGQKSGKSRRAEDLARSWLARAGGHRAVLIATARAGDAEMSRRISRHRNDRAHRIPALVTVEEPVELAAAIRLHSQADTMVVVDCLTLWLTNLMWCEHARAAPAAPTLADPVGATAALLDAITGAPGPVVVVSNEIGLGVVPMGQEVRAFVDALGTLNQRVAGFCQRATLMVAGLPLSLKSAP